MTRIGLSGTNWTRKSTTVRGLAHSLRPRRVEIVRLSNYVRDCPYPTGRDQTLDASKWIVDQLASTLQRTLPDGTIQIFDRTPLDVLAFTLYAADRNEPSAGHSKRSIARLVDAIRFLGTYFVLVFLCRPAGGWPAPESPSLEALEFARTMDRYLVTASRDWTSEIVELPWGSNARIRYIADFHVCGGNARDRAL